MIKVEELNFTYESGQNQVLKSINLQIQPGEYIAIIGPNGGGKTSLVRHFNALLLPRSGRVTVMGMNTADPKKHLEIRRMVGMIFQNPDNQIVGMSVEEDVAFGPGNLRLPAPEVRKRVSLALETVGLTTLAKRAPHTLSGGEKQLLALAGVLAMEPQFIVLDEPTAFLDPAARQKVLVLLQKLKTQGIGIIHVTHNMEEAALAERILVIEQGRLAADGTPREILSQIGWLRTLNLAPPPVTELMWQLQQAGFPFTLNALTIDEAVTELKTCLEGLSKQVNDHV